MSNEILLTIAKDYGPIFLSVVGTILLAVLSGIGWMVGYIWKNEKKNIKTIADGFKSLAESFTVLEKQNISEHGKLWDIIQQQRAELGIHIRSNDHLKSTIMNLEGIVKSQQETLFKHVEKITRVDSKLEAIFRHLDAPKRATD